MSTVWQSNPGPQTFVLSLPNNTHEILYGGARGGGKTDAGLVWIGEHQANERYRALVIRKNADDLSDWVDRVRVMFPHANVAYRPAIITFPSGAVIRTGHLKDDQAYTKYQGQEYQRMLIEELTQIPTEKRYLQLTSSCRSTIPGLQAQIMSTTNPGGVGHGWVKKRFVDFSKPFIRKPDNTSGRLRVFIPATIDDNPVLAEHDPMYVKSLDALRDTDEDLWKAWRMGDWKVFAGQAFREWRVALHVVNQFDYPLDQCQRILSFDWGYSDKAVATWLAFTPENRWGVKRCYLYRQLVKTETDPDTWADEVATYCRVDKVKYMVLPRDTFAHKESKVTIASKFEDALKPLGIHIVKADMSPGSRINRKAITHTFLSMAPDGKPYMQVHESCTDFIESIPTLVYDERNVEDIAEGDDHCLRCDTKVLTTQGYQNIGDLVGTEGYLISNGSVERYHNVRKTGIATIYELKFSNGATVHTSSEHPFLTDRGWIAAIDLRPTDRIQCINESQSYIRDKTSIRWGQLLSNGKLLQAYKQKVQRFMDITQKSMDVSQWRNRKGDRRTPQGQRPQQQSDREFRVTNKRSASSRTYQEKPQQSRVASQEAQTYARSSHAQGKGVALNTRGKKVAQAELSENERQVTPSTKIYQVIQSILQTMQSTILSFNVKSKMVFAKLYSEGSRCKETRLISWTAQSKEEVYNLEVDNTHCFAIQGGIIVHNSWDSATYGLVAYTKTNLGIIIKRGVKPTIPKGWVAQPGGIIKPVDDVMETLKRGMEKGGRTWQS